MSAPAPSPVPPTAPRLTFVTGPDAVGVARWLAGELATARSEGTCAVLACREVMAALAHATDLETAIVRELRLPCMCCPALANFPAQVDACAQESGAGRLFVALPVLAAAGLVAEFDARTRRPREFVLCLDAAWTAARREDALSYFQFSLISAADRVVEAPARRPVPLCA